MMIVPTAKNAISPQNAEPHGAEENIFPDGQGDDARRVNNDPRTGKQSRQNNQPRRDRRDVHGWVILDKPIGMTSTHAVAVVKRLFQAKRAGHAGTLDPLAYVPAIHVLLAVEFFKTWMPGIKPGMTSD